MVSIAHLRFSPNPINFQLSLQLPNALFIFLTCNLNLTLLSLEFLRVEGYEEVLNFYSILLLILNFYGTLKNYESLIERKKILISILFPTVTSFSTFLCFCLCYSNSLLLLCMYFLFSKFSSLLYLFLSILLSMYIFFLNIFFIQYQKTRLVQRCN